MAIEIKPRSNKQGLVDTTADLAGLSGRQNYTVLVKDIGIFEWSTTGPANGSDIFAGANGFWSKVNEGAVSVPFSELTEPTVAIVDIIDATEGTSIPDSSTADYTKTIPLGFSPTRALCVVLTNSAKQNDAPNPNTPYLFGVSSSISGILNMNNNTTDVNEIGKIETGIRILITSDYTQAKRAQGFSNAGSIFESNESGTRLTSGDIPTYSQLGNTLIGVYNSVNGAACVGYSSASSSYPQGHTIIKSAYISGSNLVLLLKKRAATTSQTWTRLQLKVYDLS